MNVSIAFSIKVVKSRVLRKIFILSYLFLFACSNPTAIPSLENDEKEQVQAFIKQFFLEGGAAHTLFGEKPMTDILIFCGTQEDICLDGLSKETLENLTYEEDFTFDHWAAWCKFLKQTKFKNYIFITKQSRFDPLYLIYGLVNIEQFKKVFSKYEQDFKKIDSSITFSRAMRELEQADSSFWDAVFNDHYLRGLLYGYGETNARHFSEIISMNQTPAKFSARVTEGTVQLPTYAVAGVDAQEEFYKKQKETIEKIYKNQDLIEVTFKRLSL